LTLVQYSHSLKESCGFTESVKEMRHAVFMQASTHVCMYMYTYTYVYNTYGIYRHTPTTSIWG